MNTSFADLGRNSLSRKIRNLAAIATVASAAVSPNDNILVNSVKADPPHTPALSGTVYMGREYCYVDRLSGGSAEVYNLYLGYVSAIGNGGGGGVIGTSITFAPLTNGAVGRAITEFSRLQYAEAETPPDYTQNSWKFGVCSSTAQFTSQPKGDVYFTTPQFPGNGYQGPLIEAFEGSPFHSTITYKFKPCELVLYGDREYVIFENAEQSSVEVNFHSRRPGAKGSADLGVSSLRVHPSGGYVVNFTSADPGWEMHCERLKVRDVFTSAPVEPLPSLGFSIQSNGTKVLNWTEPNSPVPVALEYCPSLSPNEKWSRLYISDTNSPGSAVSYSHEASGPSGFYRLNWLQTKINSSEQ